jgi:hypothetical protein
VEYQIIFLINGKRERLVLEHVKEEYGISPATFWTCWIADRKHINGEGETAEEAVQDMIKTKKISDDMKKAFHESINAAGAVYKTPIAESLIGAAVCSYTQQRDFMRRLR